MIFRASIARLMTRIIEKSKSRRMLIKKSDERRINR